MLHRRIPHIQRSGTLHRGTNPRVDAVVPTAQWNGATSRNGRETGWRRTRCRIHLIYGYVIVDGRGIEIMSLYRLMNQNGQVLRHGMSKVRAKDSDIVAATVSESHHGFCPHLVGDADSWPKGTKIVSNAPV